MPVSFKMASARRIARQLHITVVDLHKKSGCRDGVNCNGQGCRLGEWMGRR